MIGFNCPVCGGELNDNGKSFVCALGHCFDISKFGYVNLLMSSKSSAKRHGDDRLMVRARRDFLDKGYYSFLLDNICGICEKIVADGSVILDAGCGECYYSSNIRKHLEGCGINALFFGVDISKDALEFAFKRKSGVATAVGSVFSLPFAESSVDVLLNLFSPEAFDEYNRVLKKGGFLIRVVPLEKHLFGLKKAVYDDPYLNEQIPHEIDGFVFENEIIINKIIELSSNEDIMNLFRMTPYYYKTGINDQKKLEKIDHLITEAEFGIRIYRKG